MEKWSVIVSTAAGICAIVFGWLAATARRRTENRDDGKDHGVIMSELGYIKSSTDDIKRENRETAVKLNGLSERLTRCEESCKQAHRRLDRLDAEEK